MRRLLVLLAVVVATATGCAATDTAEAGREGPAAKVPSAPERPAQPTAATDALKPSENEPSPSAEDPPPAEPSEPGIAPDPPKRAKRTPPGVPAGAQAAVVTSITDGDTLHLSVPRQGAVLDATPDVTVRLLEIDTPESVDPGEPVQCYGPQATSALTRLAPPGSKVYVLDDQELTDSYDRTLLYVWSVADGSGRFVNKALVRGGYAIASLYEPNDLYIGAMRRAEADARASQHGLWDACPRFGAPLDRPQPEPAARPTPNGDGGGGGNCDASYSGACIPPFPPDLDCTEVDDQGFTVKGDDPHGFDADGDGIACDS